MQNKLITISLVLISLILSADFYLDRVHPFLVYKTYENNYTILFKECEAAKASMNEAENTNEAIATKRSLIASAKIQMLACDKKIKLENILLASGVKYTKLKLMQIP